MGWDLIPVDEDVEPFHTTSYAWLYIVFSALRFAGAEMRWFGDTNDGDYVPETVADAWADSLEKGLPDLKCAVIRNSGSGPFGSGAVSIIVPMHFTEDETMDCFGRRTDETRRQALPENVEMALIGVPDGGTDEEPLSVEDFDEAAEGIGIDGESLRAIAALSVNLFQEGETLTFDRFEDIDDSECVFLKDLTAFFRCSKGFYQD